MIISPLSAMGDPHKVLSPQQTIIMQYLVNGSTMKEIAMTMKIKVETVRKHITKAKIKLAAKTHDHTIALAIARGEVSVWVSQRVVSPLDSVPAETRGNSENDVIPAL